MRYIYLIIISVLLHTTAGAAEYSAAASRETGVAPLSVFFTADLTGGDATMSEYHYSWTFGDATSGTWGTDGESKNTASGPTTAHIYETPGVYIAVLTVTNPLTGSVVAGLAESFEITVTDPNTAFAGALTTCVSDTTHNDSSGCPAGATYVQTDDLTALAGYTAAGERVLLHRGSSWNHTGTISFPNNNGPVSIGAYGTCTTPDAYGVCSNAPIITSAQSAPAFLTLTFKRDWRLSDIKFVGYKDTAGTTSAYGVTTGIADVRDILMMQLDITGYGDPLGVSTYRASDAQQLLNISVASCRIRDFRNYGLFIGSENLTILGNEIKNSDLTHATRMIWAFKGVYSHNLVSGTSLVSGTGRQAMKLHGPAYWPDPEGSDGKTYVGDFATTGELGVKDFTRFVVISDNVFGASGPWPVSIGPQDSGRDERVSDVIFERNKILAQYGENSSFLCQAQLHFSGRYGTIRNNITDSTGGNQGATGIEIIHWGVEWAPQSNRIYNNTIYRRPGGSTTEYAHTGIIIHADATDTIVRNNYVSFPDVTGPKTLIDDNSGSAESSNNVMTTTPYFADPDNSNPLLRDFSLTASAIEAIDQGAAVPVYDDFAGAVRIALYDIGAFLYGEGAPEPTCSDLTQNGDETGIDCGGSCPACDEPAVRKMWGSKPIMSVTTAD